MSSLLVIALVLISLPIILLLVIKHQVSYWVLGAGVAKGPNAVTQAMLDAVTAEKARLEQPYIALVPDHDRQAGPTDSKCAGRPWAESSSADWPHSHSGAPMCFVGQINFAQMPALPGFPDRGLLQLFAAFPDDIDWQRPIASNGTTGKLQHVVRWHPDPDGDTTLTPPDGLAEFVDYLESSRPAGRNPVPANALKEVALGFAQGSVTMTSDELPPPHGIDLWNDNRPSEDRAVRRARKAILADDERQWAELNQHRIGGPVMPGEISDGVLQPGDVLPRPDRPDRVLLKLQFKWDAKGVSTNRATLLISGKDLSARRFDRTVLYWT